MILVWLGLITGELLLSCVDGAAQRAEDIPAIYHTQDLHPIILVSSVAAWQTRTIAQHI